MRKDYIINAILDMDEDEVMEFINRGHVKAFRPTPKPQDSCLKMADSISVTAIMDGDPAPGYVISKWEGKVSQRIIKRLRERRMEYLEMVAPQLFSKRSA